MSIFQSTVYGTEATANPLHFYLNLSTIIEWLLHPAVSLSVTLPVLLLQFYRAIVTASWLWTLSLVPLVCAFTLQCYFWLCKLRQSAKGRWRPWDQEVAIVTGGAGGVGFALVKRLLSSGVNVAIWDIQEPPMEELEALRADPHGNGRCGRVVFYRVDISSMGAVKADVQRVEQDLGPVTMLINNAGVVSAKSILDLEERDVTRTFNVNSIAHFWTVKAVLPGMLERRYGHIVTLASTMGLVSVSKMSDYCASKFAAVAFHDALRQELKLRPEKHLVHTTMLCPGLILTGMFDGIRIEMPFLIPPLRTGQVVDKIMESLTHMNGLDCVNASAPQSVINAALDLKQFSVFERAQQHRVSWFPVAYYLPSMLTMLLPNWISDTLIDLFGANRSITHNFRGRTKKQL